MKKIVFIMAAVMLVATAATLVLRLRKKRAFG